MGLSYLAARFRCVALLALLLAPTAVSAQDCAGDCNGDGSLTVDELIVGVSIALGTQSLAACNGFDRNRDQQVSVDEIVAGVDAALSGCEPPADDSAASSRVVTSTATSLTVIDFGLAAAGGGVRNPTGRAAMLPLLAHRASSATGGGAQIANCPDGGSLEISAFSTQRTCTLSLTFFGCLITDSETQMKIFQDGTLETTIEDPDACETGEIRPGVGFILVTSNYLIDIRDLQDVPVTVAFLDFTASLDADRGGCSGTDGVLTLDGTLAFRERASGIDTAVTADLLRADIVSQGDPCTTRTTLQGPLQVVDRFTGVESMVSYGGLLITEVTDRDGTRIQSQDGLVTDNCLGALEIDTQEPLRIPAGDACPKAGRVATTPAGGERSLVSYVDGTVEIDADGDGRPDRSLPSCQDPAVQMCMVP